MADELANRYRLGEVLGEGGFGRVHRARDLLEDREVAIKIFTTVQGSEDRARISREVAALRQLSMPGVVRLLAASTDDTSPWLAMELVPGVSFPGDLPAANPSRWAAVSARVSQLLTILAQVHQSGILHRDLKPQNVIVGPDGAVTLLDFGLARGPVLGPTLTHRGELIGTLRYMAPEQLLGLRVDARTDLYAVGLLAFEAMTSRLPFRETAQLADFVAERLTRVPSLRWLDVPPAARDLVGSLLDPDPERRPASAAEALAALEQPPAVRLPLLDRSMVVADLLARLRRGESVDVWGPRGSGKTRLLGAVEEHLVGERRTMRVGRGERPFESLAGIVAPRDAARVEAELRQAVADRAVLIVDDGSSVDRWTRALLDRIRQGSAVIRAVDVPGAVVLRPLSEVALGTLFHGPERVHHLPEDASAELLVRTRGLPGAVHDEVGRWVLTGLAHWDGDRLRVDRSTLDRLAAALPVVPLLRPVATDVAPPAVDVLEWLGIAAIALAPEVLTALTELDLWQLDLVVDELVERHLVQRFADGRVALCVAPSLPRSDPRAQEMRARLVQLLPPGSPGRLRLLVRLADAAELVSESLIVAAREEAYGRLGRASAILEVALDAVGTPAPEALLIALARCAIRIGTAPTLRGALWRCERGGQPALVRLLGAVLALRLGGEVEPGDAPFSDPELEACRLHVPIRDALRRDVGEAENRLLKLLDGLRDEGLQSRALGWLGHVRYRQERFAEAAVLHLQSIVGVTHPERRMVANLNAASASIESGMLEQAETLLDAVVVEAAAARLPQLEAHGVVLRRQLAYRQRRFGGGDPELLDIVASLGIPSLHALTAFTEATFAWRTGRREEAARLSELAARLYAAIGMDHARRLAAALSGVDRPPPDPAPPDGPSRVDQQVRALWCLARGAELPVADDAPAEVLSPDEIRALTALSRWQPGPA